MLFKYLVPKNIMYNQITIIGFLASDSKYSVKDKGTKFRLAVNENINRIFFNCILEEGSYLKLLKGSRIFVQGKVMQKEYTNNQKAKKLYYVIRAENIIML